MQIRPYDEACDRALFEQWMKSDPFHQHTNPEAFLRPEGRQSAVLEDDEGPILFMRYEKVLRLNFQFNPERSRKNIKRTGDGLQWLNQWLGQVCREEGLRPVIFNSVSQKLIAGCPTQSFV
jgi:hypothetical protein